MSIWHVMAVGIIWITAAVGAITLQKPDIYVSAIIGTVLWFLAIAFEVVNK